MMETKVEQYCKKCNDTFITSLDSPFDKERTCPYCLINKKINKKQVFQNTNKNNYIVSALIIYLLSLGMLYGLIFGFYYEIIGRIIIAMSTGALLGIGIMSLLYRFPKGE